jgi:hypothetical protein
MNITVLNRNFGKKTILAVFVMIFTYEILHISATIAPPIVPFRDYTNDYISYTIGDTK